MAVAGDAALAARVALARAFVEEVGNGGIDTRHYAPGFTVWTSTTGAIAGVDWLINLPRVAPVWRGRLAMDISSVIARAEVVCIESRSSGVLHDGQAYANAYVFVIEFDGNGRIRHIREYYRPEPVHDILRPAVAAWHARQG